MRCPRTSGTGRDAPPHASLSKSQGDGDPELDKTTLGSTNNIPARNQKVINNTNINEIEGTFQSLGNQFVCGTEPIILAGMVMNQHYGRGLGLKCQLHDLSWVHARTVNSATKEFDETQNPVMGVKQDDAEIFAVSVTERYR